LFERPLFECAGLARDRPRRVPNCPVTPSGGRAYSTASGGSQQLDSASRVYKACPRESGDRPARCATRHRTNGDFAHAARGSHAAIRQCRDRGPRAIEGRFGERSIRAADRVRKIARRFVPNFGRLAGRFCTPYDGAYLASISLRMSGKRSYWWHIGNRWPSVPQMYPSWSSR